MTKLSLTVSSNGFLSETAPLFIFIASKWQWSIQWPLAWFGATPLIYAKVPILLHTFAFVLLENGHTRNNTVLLLLLLVL